MNMELKYSPRNMRTPPIIIEEMKNLEEELSSINSADTDLIASIAETTAKINSF